MVLGSALLSTPELAELFSDRSVVKRMLDFEAALARASARANIVPANAAEAITAAARVDRFDVEALVAAAPTAGNLAIPLVDALSEAVAEESAPYVHLGATSQDVIDTAAVLLLQDAVALIEVDVRGAGEACATLAQTHRNTLMVGRTLLQQAAPITFGLKAAHWLSLMTRAAAYLERAREDVRVLQFGGAVGTLAALGSSGPEVAQLLADELDLSLPDLPWHAERDRMALCVTTVAVVAGAAGKIAQDVLLMMQSEVDEAREAAAPGKGRSSAMPHKRNPVDSTQAIAAAHLAAAAVPPLLNSLLAEHERPAAGWSTEWEAVPHACRFAGGAVRRARMLVEGLEVSPEAMKKNLDSRGMLMSESLKRLLGPHVGRADAHRLVSELVRAARDQEITLEDAALAAPEVRKHLTQEEISDAIDPAAYLGSTSNFIDAAVESWQRRPPIHTHVPRR